MADYERASFSVKQISEGDLRIMWTGARDYVGLLIASFPDVPFSSTFDSKFGTYNFGIFAKGVSESTEALITTFCHTLSSALWLKDKLNQSFALSIHGTYPNGQFRRTSIGELVYGAKPYDKPVTESHRTHAKKIASLMAAFIGSCPMYKSAGAIAAVPPSNPDKPFDLPTYMVAEITRLTKKTDVSRGIRKTRRTSPMKDFWTDAEKAANIRGAFQADSEVVSGKTIILVDDIYDSGHSINEAGRALRDAGALAVLGLTATKTQPRP